jgi:hypothetical protein
VPEETRQSDTILIAHATVYLVGGESFELIPFQSADDVKSEVNDLMESWAKSGFLLRGQRIYPWHQVLRVEVTAVDEMSRSEAAQRLVEWEINDLYRVQQGFWKTKKAREKKEEAKQPQAGGAPH